MIDLPSTPQGRVALAFVSAIAARRLADALDLLVPDLREEVSGKELYMELADQVGMRDRLDATLDLERFEVTEVGDGPPYGEDAEEGDVGWASVALIGRSRASAVRVYVTRIGDDLRIRWFEWGTRDVRLPGVK